MELTERARLLNLVASLGQKIEATAKTESSRAASSPGYVARTVYTVNRFDYTERGLVGIGFDMTEKRSRVWDGVSAPILDAAKEHDEWRALNAAGVNDIHLYNHFRSILHASFDARSFSGPDIQRMREALVDCPASLTRSDRTVRFLILALAIHCEPFSVKLGKWTLRLRRSQEQDFNHESLPGHTHFLSSLMLDAVAEIDGVFSDESEAMPLARWTEALYRLAVPSNVHIAAIEFSTINLLGTDTYHLSQGLPTTPFKGRIATIESSNQRRFVQLCESLSRKLDMKQVEESQTRLDPFAVSYNRYDESLGKSGILERRIAAAVMGVESLFMSDKDVIAYKLSTRLAKLLGMVNYNPENVRSTVADAYTIRSKYVHGDCLDSRDVKKIERRHVSLENLLNECIEVLRAALILCLVSLPDKAARISLIDAALIDSTKSDSLASAIEPGRQLLSL